CSLRRLLAVRTGRSLLPYTTLFRSRVGVAHRDHLGLGPVEPGPEGLLVADHQGVADPAEAVAAGADHHGQRLVHRHPLEPEAHLDRKSTRLNSSHVKISYAVFCLRK